MRRRNGQEAKLIRRLTLRETRSSRAALSVVVAVVLLALTLWLAAELVLSATGNQALLISPGQLANGAAVVPTATIPGALVGIGAGLALLGAALLAAALLHGAKARHAVANPRAAVVVDSEVIAAASSRAARTQAGLLPEQVSTSVGRTRLEVSIRPTSGRSVDVTAVRDAVEGETSGYGLEKPLPVHVTASKEGVVGT